MSELSDLDRKLLDLTQGYIDDYYHDISAARLVHKEHPRVSAGLVPLSSVSLALKENIGGPKGTRAYDLFARMVKRVQGTTFCPAREPDRLIRERGVRLPYLNEFTRAVHPEAFEDEERASDDYLTLWRFLRRLVPDRAEWQQVVWWLAAKVYDPSVRMHGLVMVADGTYGTGRDTLFKLVCKLIGEWNTCTIKQDSLLGKTYQSQYLEDTLWRTCLAYMSESHSVPDKGHAWTEGRKAYERLKEFIDTHPIKREVVSKGVQNSQRTFYTSFLLATNHADAFPLSDNDRRVIVVSNGAPLSPEESADVHAAMANPEAVSLLEAILSDLGRRIVEEGRHYDIYSSNPMRTQAKEQMIDQARDEVTEAVNDFVKAWSPGAAPSSWFSKEIPDKMLAGLVDISADGDHVKMLRKRIAAALRRRGRVAIRGAKLRVYGKTERIYVFGEMQVDVFKNEEVSRNYLRDLLDDCRDRLKTLPRVDGSETDGNPSSP